jgi:hypothetical protein
VTKSNFHMDFWISAELLYHRLLFLLGSCDLHFHLLQTNNRHRLVIMF